MSRVINGTLLVSSYDETLNPGEYTITNATYINFADATGNGAYDLTTGFLLFVPAADPNTFDPVPGVVHRYLITAITIVDSNHISATVLWDEGGPEVDEPLDGSLAIITEKGSGLGLGFPVSQQVYGNLLSGADLSAIAVDERSRIDGAQRWEKFTLGYGDFSDVSNTKSVPLSSLPAGGVLTGVLVMHSAAFAGSPISAYSVSVGIAASVAKYATAFDVFQAPGPDVGQLSQNLVLENKSDPTPILVTATSIGGTLNQANSGSVNVWLSWSKTE